MRRPEAIQHPLVTMFLNILTILKTFGNKLVHNQPVSAPKPSEETLESADERSKIPRAEDFFASLTDEDYASLGAYLNAINPPPRHPPEWYRERVVAIKGGRRLGRLVECKLVEPPANDDEDHDQEGCTGART